MAPVVLALIDSPEIESLVCVTAQHRQMLDQVLDLFGIQPDIDLDLMRPNQSLSQITSAVFKALDPVLADIHPDWVLVQGDTTTAMAAAIAAYYHRIHVGHVEAGLRTNDKYQPFPEELNRRVASVVADLHFAPTEWSRQNLLTEGIAPERILLTGNPVIDALKFVASLPMSPATREFLDRYDLLDDGVRFRRQLILVTAHRRENFGQPLENICLALKKLSETYQDAIQIIYPVHLNPNVQEPVNRILGGIPNIHLVSPLDYPPLVHLMKVASLVLTDSGGIQEEAPSFGVPVFVLRNVTERPEGIDAGTAKLIGTETQSIVDAASAVLDNPSARKNSAAAVNPYGDGLAAKRIVNAILNYQQTRPQAG